MPSHLNDLFDDDLNRTFFRNRLPRYRVKRRSQRFDGDEGYCDSERGVIYIVTGHDPETERRALLHEMCHIGCPGHGAAFQRKLARLARTGEAWAEEQRLEYKRAIETEPPLAASTPSRISPWSGRTCRG